MDFQLSDPTKRAIKSKAMLNKYLVDSYVAVQARQTTSTETDGASCCFLAVPARLGPVRDQSHTTDEAHHEAWPQTLLGPVRDQRWQKP